MAWQRHCWASLVVGCDDGVDLQYRHGVSQCDGRKYLLTCMSHQWPLHLHVPSTSPWLCVAWGIVKLVVVGVVMLVVVAHRCCAGVVVVACCESGEVVWVWRVVVWLRLVSISKQISIQNLPHTNNRPCCLWAEVRGTATCERCCRVSIGSINAAVSRTKHVWYSEHGTYYRFEFILERAMSATHIAVILCTRTSPAYEEEFMKMDYPDARDEYGMS